MRRLAASFVVTVAVVDCRAPQRVDTTASPPSVARGTDGVCRYHPTGSSGGNPPPVYDVECPPELGGPSNDARPKGREGWLRERPWLQLEYGADHCRMYGEGFCPAPPRDEPCAFPPDLPKVACAPVVADGGTHIHVEPFRWTDAIGRCHRVDAFDCTGACQVPEGEIVACE